MGNLALPQANPDYELYPGISPPYIISLKVLASVVCFLSIIGATGVIINGFTWRNMNRRRISECCCSYDSDPEIKHFWPSYNYKFIIFLSISDILVAFSHLWGILQNLEGKFIDAYQPAGALKNSTGGTDVQCTLQAALNSFSTVSSFLWTLTLMISVVAIEGCRGYTNKKFLRRYCPDAEVAEDKPEDPHWCDTMIFNNICPLISFGIPLLLVFSLSVAGVLGFSESLDTGKKYIIIVS